MKSLRPNVIFWFIAYGVTLASSELGISLRLRGVLIPNHGYVRTIDVGESELDSLRCETDLERCCEDEKLGFWTFPSHEQVGDRSNGRLYFTTRGDQVVRLHHRGMGEEGMFRCQLPDARGFPTNKVAVVGIYRMGMGLPEVYSLSFDMRTLTINCYSQSGPVTEFSWTKNNERRPLQNGVEYLQSKAIFDYTSAKYLITLKATKAKDIVGTFRCGVKNSAGFNERSIVIHSNFSFQVTKGCGSLAHLKNGHQNLSKSFDVGSIATAICEPQYKLSGLTQRNCMDNGRTGNWVGGSVECRRNRVCQHGINYVFHTYVRYSDGFNENSEAIFSCHKGYHMLVSTKVICKNGEWQGDLPSCVIKQCSDRNSHLAYELFHTHHELPAVVGTVATVSCNPPDVRTGMPAEQVCTDVEGESYGSWVGERPDCKRNGTCRPNLKPGPNVIVQYTNLQAVFKCKKGYILKGQPYVECETVNYRWKKHEMPFCAGAQHLNYNLGSYLFMILWIVVQ